MSFLSNLLKRFSGRHYRKFYARCRPIIQRVNEIEREYQALADDQLRAKTAEFRKRLAEGETLDSLLPEAFAAAKNAARRLCGQEILVCGQPTVWQMVHFDVQIIGGIALHERKIAEMATGEGKTLVATLPVYLNALTGRGVHVVTVNDYLARRDSEWMGALFQFLGLTVGCIQQMMPPALRKEMYQRDITYGTASEFGFDYLRDNGLALRAADQVQRGHFYCIVDEVDSILIDEARTPLIISGPAPIERELPFQQFKPAIERLAAEQTRLCNALAHEATALLESPKGDWREAARKMWLVKQGSPRNKQLFRLLENGDNRKLLDRLDLELHSDIQKQELYALKEQLYFTIDEKQHQADLTEKGRTFLRPDDPDAFMLPDLATQFVEIEKRDDLTPEQREQEKAKAQENFEKLSETIHTISQLLRAYTLYERDVEYVVQDGKVMIVDEHTGRLMPGRRWSDGLHQAVEAKEGVAIEKETRTYATITIQNYFRLYEKLAGMTGTAETEATEFHDIYRLGVMVIPTNKPCIRIDKNDTVYKTRKEKYKAAIEEISAAHARGQPVLVGTASVESSEVLSRMLKGARIPHTVLNAKLHQQEAEIVSRAGQQGAVTIATNMAGRGTDIKLGEGVPELGGLYVIGTERHESRRIDRQLRGRSARQGDPGMSKFFLSLEDDLLRLFLDAGPIGRLMKSSFVEGEPLEHPLLNRSIESAQKKVEQQNYAIRKRLLQYDDVLNKQREIIYAIRNDALHSEDPRRIILQMIEEEVDFRLEKAGLAAGATISRQELESLVGWVNLHFPVGLRIEALPEDPSQWRNAILEAIHSAYRIKESVEDKDGLVQVERFVILNAIDSLWQGHLTEMEELRRSVGLRSYGQKDPLAEYKSEAYAYFEELMANIRLRICGGIFRSATSVEAFNNLLASLGRQARATGPSGTATAAPTRPTPPAPQITTTVTYGGSTVAPPATTAARPPDSGKSTKEIELPKIEPMKAAGPKLGRNDPCPLNPSKKFKNCCGADGSKYCHRAGLRSEMKR